MFEEFAGLEIKEVLQLNAKLQKKKNAARKKLAEMGVLQKGGKNDYDHYKYFSEAQYKELITKLFSECGLELTATVLSYDLIQGTSGQSQGRVIKYEMILSDVETGFYEKSIAVGEGFDKGDKGGYKASTGALKYYLANTFMVATGDDPEKDSPEVTGKGSKTEVIAEEEKKVSERQVQLLSKIYVGENLTKLLEANKIEKIEDLPLKKGSALIQAWQKKHINKENKDVPNN